MARLLHLVHCTLIYFNQIQYKQKNVTLPTTFASVNTVKYESCIAYPSSTGISQLIAISQRR